MTLFAATRTEEGLGFLFDFYYKDLHNFWLQKEFEIFKGKVAIQAPSQT